MPNPEQSEIDSMTIAVKHEDIKSRYFVMIQIRTGEEFPTHSILAELDTLEQAKRYIAVFKPWRTLENQGMF